LITQTKPRKEAMLVINGKTNIEGVTATGLEENNHAEPEMKVNVHMARG